MLFVLLLLSSDCCTTAYFDHSYQVIFLKLWENWISPHSFFIFQQSAPRYFIAGNRYYFEVGCVGAISDIHFFGSFLFNLDQVRYVQLGSFNYGKVALRLNNPGIYLFLYPLLFFIIVLFVCFFSHKK